MNNLDIIIKAINKKKQIAFEYDRDGKIKGVRVGNPYAVFILTSKSKRKSTKLHLLQTNGVSDSIEKNPLPCFKTFNIESISKVKILDKSFIPTNEKYNPDWKGYKNVIAKV